MQYARNVVPILIQCRFFHVKMVRNGTKCCYIINNQLDNIPTLAGVDRVIIYQFDI